MGANDIGDISVAQAIFCEVLATFTLVLSVFANAVDPQVAFFSRKS